MKKYSKWSKLFVPFFSYQCQFGHGVNTKCTSGNRAGQKFEKKNTFRLHGDIYCSQEANEKVFI